MATENDDEQINLGGNKSAEASLNSSSKLFMWGHPAQRWCDQSTLPLRNVISEHLMSINSRPPQPPCDWYEITSISIFLIISGAHMNIWFIVRSEDSRAWLMVI